MRPAYAMLASSLVLLAGTVPAAAQREDVTAQWAASFDGGFASHYDDSDMWGRGYDVGVSGWWLPVASAWSFGARFSITHWSYDPDSVVDALTPPGTTVALEQSTGDLQLLSLAPLARYARENVLPGKLGAFGEAGAGIAYVKTFALTEIIYTTGAAGGGDSIEISESDWFATVRAAAGLSRAVSSSSWIDLVPSYRAVFGDAVEHVVTISLAFRARV